MTADEKTYSLQPCFGIEYEAGTLFCENCRDKKECWVKMETGCIPTAGRRTVSEEIWKCVVCGKITNTPHEHTLKEALDAWRNTPEEFYNLPGRTGGEGNV